VKRIAVIHGPNLNMLGKREIGIYGGKSLDDINAEIAAEAQRLGVEVEFHQSNVEGELVTIVQQGRGRLDGIVQFNHLSPRIMELIVDKNMKELKSMLKAKKITLSYSATARSFLAKKGYDPN